MPKDNKKFRKKNSPPRVEREYDQKMVHIARVTRVMKGGKRMRFRVCMVIGDKKGKVSYGVSKGPDVQSAIEKAVRQAEKNIARVVMTDTKTIPHTLNETFKSAQVLIKPAKPGTGVKAGGAPRVVLEMAGIQNIVAKQLGSNNKISNTKATINALQKLHEPRIRKDKKNSKKRTKEGKESIKKQETVA